MMTTICIGKNIVMLTMITSVLNQIQHGRHDTSYSQLFGYGVYNYNSRSYTVLGGITKFNPKWIKVMVHIGTPTNGINWLTGYHT